MMFRSLLPLLAGASIALATFSGAPAATASESGRPTPARIRAMREQAATERIRIEAEARAQAETATFEWPTAPQAAITWKVEDLELDGFTVTHSFLRTPQHTLSAEMLREFSPRRRGSGHLAAGLVLGNAVRADILIECFSFRGQSLLPDLEPASIARYQASLASAYDDAKVELIDRNRSLHTFGPPTADLNTRRVRFRLHREPDEAGNAALPTEVVDYLVPLPGELLIVRFSAPPDLFKKASEELERFLTQLKLEDSRVTTVAR